MTSFSPLFFILMLVSTLHSLQAHNTDQPYRDRRNSIKAGFFLTKADISYECAFIRHASIGILATGNMGPRFPGYSMSAFGRYYFTKFNQSGWFLEAKATAGHYSPEVYGEQDSYGNYHDFHIGNVDFIGGTLSGGCKKYCNKFIFFEFITGLRTGQATFGKNDVYYPRSMFATLAGTDDVKEMFVASGPGSYIDVMIRLGIAF